jgi:hypothetical protein
VSNPRKRTTKGAPGAGAPAYRIKPGAHLRRADAEALAGVMAELATQKLSTEQQCRKLVEMARPKKSPIHHCFEWDDKRAADAHRIQQARYYWRSIEVTLDTEDATEKPIRAFHPVFADGERRYTDVQTITESVDLAAQLVAQAKSELKSFRNRYDIIRDHMAPVFKAIDDSLDAENLGEQAAE